MLCQRLKHVPLQVAVDRESDIASVNGLIDYLRRPRETDSISAPLICRRTVDGPQTRVIFALDTCEWFITTEHSGQIRRHRAKRIRPLAHQVHLEPWVTQLSQQLTILGAHTLEQVGEMGTRVLINRIEPFVRVCLGDGSDFGHRASHRHHLAIAPEITDLPGVGTDVIAINISG